MTVRASEVSALIRAAFAFVDDPSPARLEALRAAVEDLRRARARAGARARTARDAAGERVRFRSRGR